MTFLKRITITCLFVLSFATSSSYAQNFQSIDSSYAHNALGPGIALSTGSDHSDNAGLFGLKGYGAQFNAQIRLSHSLAFIPSIGLEMPYPLYLGAAARYFVNRSLYIQGGVLLQVAGAGLDYSGLRPTAGLGYQLYTVKNQFLDINLHLDRINAEGTMDNLIGLRVTYNFILSGGITSSKSDAGEGPKARRPRPFPPLPFNL